MNSYDNYYSIPHLLSTLILPAIQSRFLHVECEHRHQPRHNGRPESQDIPASLCIRHCCPLRIPINYQSHIMSSPVSAVVPAGAYVIRNRKTSTVLHIQHPDAKHQDTSLQAYQQDESQFADQQIWWLEPLANYNDADSSKGVVYSISSPGSGKSLDANPDSGALPCWLIRLTVLMQFITQVGSTRMNIRGSPGSAGGSRRSQIQMGR